MEMLRERLLTEGLVVDRDECSWEDFVARSGAIGRVIQTEDVKLHQSSRRLHQPQALEFHTDYPGARFVGWWCASQDDEGGATDVVDGFAAAQWISRPSRARLDRTPIASFGRGDLPRLDWPVFFRHTSGAAGINYNPFGWPDRPSQETVHALLEFRLALREEFAQAPHSVRLLPGQTFWIDNWRMLHGRAALNSGGRRHLKRVWIQVDGAGK